MLKLKSPAHQANLPALAIVLWYNCQLFYALEAFYVTQFIVIILDGEGESM